MPVEERAFYTLDRDLRLLDAGPRALAVWGKSRRELIGRRLVDAFPFVQGSAMEAALTEALQTLRPVRIRMNSVVLGRSVEVEIYPVHGVVQVSFWPSSE